MISQSPKVSGIILAAGKAERMDKAKQLLPFRGTTILGQVSKNALDSSLHEIIVVLGYAAEKIRQVTDFGHAQIVINPDYADGQSASLKAGLSGISDESVAALFLLGDQPLIGADVIDAILEVYRNAPAPIVIPTYSGTRGNPVLIDRALFPRIKSLRGDVGARFLFDEYADQLLEIEMGDEYLAFDVDTPDDYARLIETERETAG
jgi:molybdenum cofactor cytidylyltransferase